MADETTPEVYQLHVWVRQISPMIWRRLLVRSDSTLANLHDVLQIAFGWSNLHLHRFRIHGRGYGINRVGGLWFSHDAQTVPHLSRKERISIGNYDLRRAAPSELTLCSQWTPVRFQNSIP